MCGSDDSRSKSNSVKHWGFPDSSVGKESACNAGDPGLIPGSGRAAGEGIGYPLQDSWASLVVGKRPKDTFLQRRHTDGQQVHEKMLRITSYLRNANQNNNEVITSHRSEWPSSKNLQTINAGEGVEKREHSYTVGGNVYCTATMEIRWRFLKKLKLEIPYDLAIPLLGIYPKKTLI